MRAASLRHPGWEAIAGLRHDFLPGRVAAPVGTLFPRQVHGTMVVTAGPAVPSVEADGVVVGHGGGLVGVVTADCAPILLVARERRVAAAVHAGWRGAAHGVIEAALAHLATAFGVEPRELEAAIGPAIGACCYEVGPEVRAAFEARTGDRTAAAWSRRGGRDVLDLRRAATDLLRAAGVGPVEVLGPCTRCSPDHCSFRRDGAGAGRQASVIGWR
jgi:hypothetical protein